MSIFALNLCNAQVTETKILPSDPEGINSFGFSVAMGGTAMVVGCGDANYLGPKTGVALVFRNNNGEWIEDTILMPNDWMDAARFGWSVDVQYDYLFISSIHDGANGLWAGAVYVYKYDPINSLWVQHQKLVSSDIELGDEFGSSVSVNGDRLLIGAKGDQSHVGAAYVFKRTESDWIEEAKLLPLNYVGDEPYFGQSVSLDGDKAIIGAPLDDDHGLQTGSAFIFHFDGSNWIQQQKIFSSDILPSDYFGTSVSISGEYIMVGAIGNMTQPNSHGAVYVYKWDGTQWSEQQKLYDNNVTNDIGYGLSISLEEDLAIIGAPEETENGVNAGAVYVYENGGSSWNEIARLLASDGQESDKLGWSVDLDNGRATAGAVLQYAGGYHCGAVYVFEGFLSALPESPDLLNFSLYPVPARDIVHCRLSIVDCPFKVELYDVYGKKVRIHNKCNEQEFILHVRNLSPGVYFIQVKAGKKIGVRKLIIR
jgi:hypothetical protein